MPTDVQFVTQKGSEIRFAYRWASQMSWSTLAAGLFGLTGSRAPLGRWWLNALTFAFGAIALHAMLWRETLVCDVRSRRWTHRRGFWLRRRTDEGGFDDFDGLILGIESGSRGDAVWVIRLAIKSRAQSIALGEFLDEPDACKRFAQLVNILRVDAIDRTGERERRQCWEVMDRSRPVRASGATRRLAPNLTASPPPPGSTIHMFGPPNSSIVLPSPRSLLLTVGPLLIGGCCLVFGAMLWRNSAAVGESPSRASVAVVATLFCACGAGVILFGLGESMAHDELHNRGAHLLFGHRVFGRLTRRRSFDKRYIEEISLLPVRGARTRGSLGSTAGSTSYPLKASETHHVFVCSPQGRLRIGAHLAAEEQEWLRRTLNAWVSQ